MTGTRQDVDDEHLQRRLDAARRAVAEQHEALRAARRRRREVEAAASARADRMVARVLRAQGHRSADPPVPSSPADWPEHGSTAARESDDRG